jgi:hypothetical protein
MTRLVARTQVEVLRLGGALRRYWRRIALGAVCGWFASSVVGAFFLVWLEAVGIVRSEEVVALLGAAIVWFGIGLGAIVAYAMRPAAAPAQHS